MKTNDQIFDQWKKAVEAHEQPLLCIGWNSHHNEPIVCFIDEKITVTAALAAAALMRFTADKLQAVAENPDQLPPVDFPGRN
jgi:hypothetical protein